MGLINAQQTPPQPDNQAGFSSPQQPPTQNDADTKAKTLQVQRIVLAAQKVMYSKETGVEFLKALQGDDVVKMAANAATSVMLILISESKFKIDPSLVIPAGVLIIGDIMDFIEQGKGIKHTEEQVEDAILAFVKQIMASVTPDNKGVAQVQPPVQPQGAM